MAGTADLQKHACVNSSVSQLPASRRASHSSLKLLLLIRSQEGAWLGPLSAMSKQTFKLTQQSSVHSRSLRVEAQFQAAQPGDARQQQICLHTGPLPKHTQELDLNEELMLAWPGMQHCSGVAHCEHGRVWAVTHLSTAGEVQLAAMSQLGSSRLLQSRHTCSLARTPRSHTGASPWTCSMLRSADEGETYSGNAAVVTYRCNAARPDVF